MDDLDDVFDTSGIATLEDEPPERLPETAPETDLPFRGGRTKRDISRFLFVDIETIPDWDRLDSFGLEVPGVPRPRKPHGECPKIEDVLDQAIEQIKYDLNLHLPCDEWLADLIAAENNAKKPRAGVRDAVKSLLSACASELTAEADFIKKLSVNPHYCKIAALGMAAGNSEAVGFIGDERTMLQEFWLMASISNPIVGFNHTNFDLPVILVRSMILGIEPTRKLDLKPWSDSCLDLMVSLFGRGQAIKLKTLAKMLGLTVQAEGCDGSQVHKLIETDPEAVRRYVASDVELTRDLYRKMEGYFA